jgi:integrase
MSLMSWSAAVQTERAVGERSVSGRGARVAGPFFTPHQLRHTYATVVRRGGVPVEIVSKLLCHRSVKTTSDIYLHASPEDLRAELERAGVLERLGALT